MTIYTVGFNKKDARTFFNLLKKHGIQKILDIRLNNKSQLSGYTKGKDLSFIANEGFGIEYEHVEDFAPTKEILDNYKDKKKVTYNDWNTYEKKFMAVLTSRETCKRFDEVTTGLERVVFLCAEPTAEQCHRRLVAEYLQSLDPTIEIIHI